MPPVAHALSPGSLVLGRYHPLRPLGSGGSGSVWLARDERTGLDVALKIVPREGTKGTRAEREAAAAARLRHPRCLRAYALARDESHVYIAYEYVPGRTMREALRAGELTDAAAIEVAAQVLDGLAHAHARGIVHRDVKPANVFLAEGPGVEAKLLDFGLALMREEETLTAAGDIPGTLAYISPERLRGETATPATDVWSVGVLLWEALAGEHPFWGGTLLETARAIEGGAPSLRTKRPDLPKALTLVVDRALSVDPRKRPSAAAMAEQLRRVQAARRRPRRRSLPSPALPSSAASVPALAGRALPSAAPGLYAGWTSAALPFYPGSWAPLLGGIAAGLSLWQPRLGLAFALAVPVFPLGNHSLGLALLYAGVAAGWLVLSWRDPRAGLFFSLGPLLAPIGGLGLLPLLGQAVRSPVRRAAQVAAAVLAAKAVAGVSHLSRLGIAASEQPLTVGGALWRALLASGGLLPLALALAACALLLPHARGRGRWGIAGFGAATLALALLPSDAAPALPFVVATWATCAALALGPRVRARQ